MVVVPLVTLVTALCAVWSSGLGETSKRRTIKLLAYLVTMFIVCHTPKVRFNAYIVRFSTAHNSSDTIPLSHEIFRSC